MGFFDDPDLSNSVVERLENILAELAVEAPGHIGVVSEASAGVQIKLQCVFVEQVVGEIWGPGRPSG